MQKIVNRDYQQECIDAINRHPEGKYIIALATGLGKTVIFSQIKRNGRMLILSHRDELVRQPEKYFDCSFSVEKADEHAGNTEVVSASVQTLSSDNRLNAFRPDDFYTIVIDEAHHAAAPSYKKILAYFTGAKQIIGMTATPRRGDKLKLDDVFDTILYQKDLRWGIRHNYLAPIRAERITAAYTLGGVGKARGDYKQEELELAINNESVIATAAKAYIDDCHNAGRQTLIYCTSVNMCNALQTSICEMLPENEKASIQIVTGATTADTRASVLSGFMNRTVRCIINCMVLTEGTDLPICDAIICLRPTCNSSLYQQIVGRGTRLYNSKDYCLVIDIIPTDEKHSKSLCTAPTLFGVEPRFLTKEEQEEITDKNDLLTLCDEFSGVSKDAIDKLRLKKKTYSVFINSISDLFAASAGGGLVDLYANYLNYLDGFDDDDGEIDFRDFCVLHQAEESKYYMIRPNYEDAIYVSKPDILGNVTVEFDITPSCIGLSDQKSVFRGTMKADQAVNLIQEYCECEPSRSKYAWSKSAREGWKQERCTGKQQWRLAQEFENTSISCDDAAHIDKLAASDLIDLGEQLKKSQKNMLETDKMLKSADSMIKNGIHSEERAKLTATEIPARPIGELQSAINNFKKQVAASDNKNYRPMTKEQQEHLKEWLRRGYITYRKEDNRGYNHPASDAQIRFAVSLVHELAEKGFIISPDITKIRSSTITSKAASAIIDFCKSPTMQNFGTLPNPVYISLADFLTFGRNTSVSVILHCGENIHKMLGGR